MITVKSDVTHIINWISPLLKIGTIIMKADEIQTSLLVHMAC